MDNSDLSEAEGFRLAVIDLLAEGFYCRPGLIDSFNPEKNTAEVSVAIKRKKIVDQKAEYENLPLIVNVPVVTMFDQNSGLSITFPIKKGNPCLLLFSDRMIDLFIKTGDFSYPESVSINTLTSEPRIHDMSDCICIPGLITQNKPILNWNNDAVELRDENRDRYVSVNLDSVESKFNNRLIHLDDNIIQVTDGMGEIRLENGRLIISAPNGIDITSPDFEIHNGQGWVTSTFRAANLLTTAGFIANSHGHSRVEPGGGVSGPFV